MSSELVRRFCGFGRWLMSSYSTLLNFITTNVSDSVRDGYVVLLTSVQVLHTQILKFHEVFQEAKSFDDMIRLQNEQCAV